jgi:hypothetical protein
MAGPTVKWFPRNLAVSTVGYARALVYQHSARAGDKRLQPAEPSPSQFVCNFTSISSLERQLHLDLKLVDH